MSDFALFFSQGETELSENLPAVPGFDLRNVTAQTPVVIDAGGDRVVMCAAQVLEWVAPGAPLNDAMRFLFVCRAARLNPLLGEAYLLPMGGKWGTVIAKSGYLKRGQDHPLYDGHESGIVIQNNRTGECRDVAGAVRPKEYTAVGGWCRAWRKGVSRPVYRSVSFDEYNKGTATWRSIPLTMIEKVAIVATFRDAYGIGDAYDESEYGGEIPVNKPNVNVVGAVPENKQLEHSGPFDVDMVDAVGGTTSYRTKDTVGWVAPHLLQEMESLSEALDLSDEEVRSMLEKRGVSDPNDLTVAQAEEILVKLRAMVTSVEADIIFGPAPAAQPDAATVVLPEVSRRGEPTEEATAEPSTESETVAD